MGRPNWRKPEDYDWLDSATPAQWAWEFLRRNPEYINAWERYVDAICTQQERPGPPYADELNGAWEWGFIGNYLDPNKSHSDIKFIPKIEAGFVMMIPKQRHKGVRFVGSLPDYKTGDVLLKFNFLQKDTESQLKAAQKELFRLRQEAKERGSIIAKASKLRHDQEDWKLLLRMVDAGVEIPKLKAKEIARVLNPDDKSYDIYAGDKWVNEKRKTAKRYIEKDYRLIPYSGR